MFMGVNGFRFTTSSNESGVGLKEPTTTRSEMRIKRSHFGRHQTISF